MSSQLASITAVVPAYNAAGSISDVVFELLPLVTEVLVIDDGSSDDTAQLAARAGARVIQLPSNAGYIRAILTGFGAVNTGVLVTVDADGEMPVEMIPELTSPICSGRADMVQGSRKSGVRPSERLISWIASWGGAVGDSGTGFRAMRSDLAGQLHLQGACICGILSLEILELDARILDVPILLRTIPAPRGIAWMHARQIFTVSFRVLRRFARRLRRTFPGWTKVQN
jgi:polyprenyl-phospho-N-acetylgalactosaminyl synthase